MLVIECCVAVQRAIAVPMKAMIASTPVGRAAEPPELLGGVGREDVAQELEAAAVDRRRVAVHEVVDLVHVHASSSSSSRSRSLKRWIFVADIGHSSLLMKRITRGSLNEAILPRQCSISSSSVALAPGQQLDERGRHLEQPLVRDADDLDEADRRVQRELGLDLLRRDVLAADLQRLLDAAEEEHAARARPSRPGRPSSPSRRAGSTRRS